MLWYLNPGVYSSAVSGKKQTNKQTNQKKNIHHIIKIQSCDQTIRYIQLIMHPVLEGMFISYIYLVILKVNTRLQSPGPDMQLKMWRIKTQ